MKVLFATDASANAKSAAEYFVNLGIASDSELTVLTVSHDPATMSNSFVPWADDWSEHEEMRVQKHHAEIGDLLAGSGATIEKLHRIGNPAQEILAVAKERGVDLIVMSALGHSMIRRLLLGSVSDRVATHAECSVLVIRPGQPRPVSKVTLAFDGSHAAKAAATELLQQAWNPDVSVVSVVQEYDYLLGDGMSAAVLANEQKWFEHMRDENTRVTQEIKEVIPHAEPTVVKGYHVGDAIVEFLEKEDSDLVIVGDSGHGAVEDWIVGSTTKFILRHAPCSVWISRHHRR